MSIQLYDLPNEIAFPILDRCCTLRLRKVSREFRVLVDDFLEWRMQELQLLIPPLVRAEIDVLKLKEKPRWKILETFLQCIDLFHENVNFSNLERLLTYDRIKMEIHYENCNLNVFPLESLNRWGGIVKIDLSHNNIKTIPLDLIRVSETLEELNISHNKIEELELPPLCNLHTLNASHNRIHRIWVYGCKRLTKINLSHNRLRSITQLTSLGFNFGLLDLSHNPLLRIDQHLFFDDTNLNIKHTPIGMLHPQLYCILENICIISLILFIYRIHLRKPPFSDD